MASSDGSVVYALVKDQKVKERIASDLVDSKCVINLKFGDDIIVDLKVVGSSQSAIKCQDNPSVPRSIFNQPKQKTPIWFSFGADKYFWDCAVLGSGNDIIFNLDGELYKIQSRSEFRLQIKDDYQIAYSVKKSGSSENETVCSVKDISSQGMGFIVQGGTHWSLGDLLKGELKFANHQPFQIAGTIRYMKGQGDITICGIEFNHSVAQTADKLQEMVAIYRQEVFKG